MASLNETFTLVEYTTVETATVYDNSSFDNNDQYPPGAGGTLKTSNTVAVVSTVCYIVIFFLAIIGNSLVVVTLVQNKRMRTVTNVFLLSLSISDIIFIVVCLPFTLVGTLLHNFIFGTFMCKLIQYMQHVTVAVSVWTMVGISLERYHAICNPLASRAWQTKTRAYKIIAITWILPIIIYFPYFIVTQLIPIDTSRTTVKCRPKINPKGANIYNIFTFIILMFIPCITLAIAYGLIVLELQRGMAHEKRATKDEKEKNGTPLRDLSTAVTTVGADSNANDQLLGKHGHNKTKPDMTKGRTINVVRSTSSNEAKKRVVRMLIVLVVLFFMAWLPTWTVNMWFIIHPTSAVRFFGIKHPSLLLLARLVSYASACVNPIVYCFMNKKFRNGFIEAFSCCCCKQEWHPVPGTHTADYRSGRTGNRSHVVSTTHYTDVSTGDDD